MASAPIALTALHRDLSIKPRWLSPYELLWLAFVIVQALDGALSYVGVSIHGLSIEGNPLVAWYLTLFGPALGFIAAKLFAVMCGAVLYLAGRYRWVAVLTGVYVLFAVGPWMHILSDSF